MDYAGTGSLFKLFSDVVTDAVGGVSYLLSTPAGTIIVFAASIGFLYLIYRTVMKFTNMGGGQ